MRNIISVAALLGFCFLRIAYADEYTTKPQAPAAVIPPLERTGLLIYCIDCGTSYFSPSKHEILLKDLAAARYLKKLRQALYQQDILHQFESKAHFDNCDFDSATAYIQSLWAEVGTHVAVASKAGENGNIAKKESAASRAFFAMGQALHAVQDFYAHTNYVEMQAPKARSLSDIEIIAPWRAEGRDRIKELRQQGLYSGYVIWGLPKKCPANTPSHGDLAKDTADTKSGSKKLPQLQNATQHEVAIYLARQASMDFMKDAFIQWPLLKELNGEYVAFEALVDRRGIDGWQQH